ncbi:MICOS complex subunit MIC25 isoform X7 [Calonectris borealis]|uniref:MICOS complex subunit MIC25 isoform X7 n=1 Tax=Calonectris borealis TaxID=1323832 RepID=UPI003F4BA6ED
MRLSRQVTAQSSLRVGVVSSLEDCGETACAKADKGFLLSEDVVNRMKESPQSKRDNQRSPRSSNGTAPSSPAAEGNPKSPTGIQLPMPGDSGQKSSAAEQELYRRYEREQALVQEELLRLAKREREAASEALNTALQRERNNTNEERQRVAQLNAEIYKLTSEQYQEAAAKAEEWIKQRPDLDPSMGGGEEDLKSWISCSRWVPELVSRTWVTCVLLDSAGYASLWRRNTDPVCASLQSEILKCYQENKREVLKCSELAKEYQRCVSAAQKAYSCPFLFQTQGQQLLDS